MPVAFIVEPVVHATVIRPASPADVPQIVALGSDQLDELYPGLPHDTDRLASLALTVMTHADGSVQVADCRGTLVGMIGGLLVTQPITGHRVASELWWFVSTHDRGHVGSRLLSAFENWAKMRGASHVHMMTPPGRVEVLYRRRGYRALEVTYEKLLG